MGITKQQEETSELIDRSDQIPDKRKTTGKNPSLVGRRIVGRRNNCQTRRSGRICLSSGELIAERDQNRLSTKELFVGRRIDQNGTIWKNLSFVIAERDGRDRRIDRQTGVDCRTG